MDRASVGSPREALVAVLQEDFAHHLRSYPSIEAVLIAANVSAPMVNGRTLNPALVAFLNKSNIKERGFRNSSLKAATAPVIRAALAIAVRQGGEIAAALSFADAKTLYYVLDVDVLSALEDDVPCLTKLITKSDEKRSCHEPPSPVRPLSN